MRTLRRRRDATVKAELMHSVEARFGVDPEKYLVDGSIVIAAITSCTNTSNPYVMMAAGLLAKKAVEAGSADAAVGEDFAGAGVARGDGLLHARGAVAVSGCAAVSGGGVWMHDVHWEQRAAADGCVEGD